MDINTFSVPQVITFVYVHYTRHTVSRNINTVCITSINTVCITVCQLTCVHRQICAVTCMQNSV